MEASKSGYAVRTFTKAWERASTSSQAFFCLRHQANASSAFSPNSAATLSTRGSSSLRGDIPLMICERVLGWTAAALAIFQAGRSFSLRRIRNSLEILGFFESIMIIVAQRGNAIQKQAQTAENRHKIGANRAYLGHSLLGKRSILASLQLERLIGEVLAD